MMRISQGQNRGVSPVIAVLLLTAIVVVMSAVLGGYAIGVTNKTLNSVSPQPQGTFEFDRVDGNNDGTVDGVTVTYTQGKNADATNVLLVGGSNGEQNWHSDLGGSEELSPGDSVTYDASPGDEVVVVYRAEDGETSKVLARIEV